MEQKSCKNCKNNFSLTAEDFAYYDQIKVPSPTHCPSCRQQRRLAFRNERYLFKRQCDLCHKEIISFFKAGTAFPVYCPTCWWSDKWDALDYGQDFDFSRPFFEQFQGLMNKVPKMALLQLNTENSDYNTLLAYSKNTYMSPGSYFMEDSYYVRKSQYCKDCLNSNFLDHCELVSDSINCKNCYQSHHLTSCRNCSDSGYLADCSSCQSCFMCSGISNKKFHIKNKPHKEEDYRKIIAEKLQQDPAELMKEFEDFHKTIPKKYQNQTNCENSSGDYIQNCKNAIESYDCFNVEDSKYIVECVTVKNSMDLTMHDKNIQFGYECCSGGESNYNLKFSFCSCACQNSDYLYSCFYLSDSFGCDSMHVKQSHCILNKKYSAEQYESLKNRIIEHMKKTGEYGEFFPIGISNHAYNNTTAADYFSISRKEATAKGYQWEDKNPQEYKESTASIPLDIQKVPDDVTKQTFACTQCGKNYRIIIQELQLSRKLGLPLSRWCAHCRQLDLQKRKNPRKLCQRICAKCSTSIHTTYTPERSEKVYCEKCYAEEVY